MIRNAGGVVTEDEIRSLAISQRLLGTEEIILIHHTDCGMLTFTDDEFKRSVEDDTGIRPAWAAEAFDDIEKDVLQSIARIQASPFIPRKESVRGFVYEVETGRLREVTPAAAGVPLPADGRGAGAAGGRPPAEPRRDGRPRGRPGLPARAPGRPAALARPGSAPSQALVASRCCRRSCAASSISLWRHSAAR